MAFKSKLCAGKGLNSQSREIIGNVFDFMLQEAEENNEVMTEGQVRKKVSEATGVSVTSVYRISVEKKKISTGK